MAYDVILALPIGSTSTSAAFANSVGLRTIVNGVTYRLMKTDTAAIAASANCLLKFKTGSAGVWVIDGLAAAASATALVAGIPQLPSGVTAAPASSYLWVARKGRVTGTTAAAVAAGVGLAVTGAAGGLDDLTVTYDTVVARAPDAIGSATTGTVELCLE